MKHKTLLLSLAALLFGWCGALAQVDDTLWTKYVWPDFLVATDFSPDESKVLAAAHGGLFVYDTETGELIKLWREPYLNYGKMEKVIFSKKENLMFARYDDIAIMWDWEKEKMLWFTTKEHERMAQYNSFIWDQNYDNLIFIENNLTTDGSLNKDKRIIFYDKNTGEQLNTISKSVDGDTGDPAAISSNEKYIATLGVKSYWPESNKYRFVVLWDFETGNDYVISMPTREVPPSILTFSPDNNYLAMGGMSGILRIYDMNQDTDNGNSKQLVKQMGFDSEIAAIKYSSDNKFIYISKKNWDIYSIDVYDINTWEIVYSYPYSVENLSLAENANIVAFNGYYVYLLKDGVYSSVLLPIIDTTLYPNPTNNLVNISFTNRDTGNVNISIYNESGVFIETVANMVYESGSHTIAYNCSNLPSGVYFCLITIGSATFTQNIVIIR